MKELITALIKAKKEFLPIGKDKVNPFFKSRYANLDNVLHAVESGLSNNGLVIVQTLDGHTLITTLWHISGESIESKYPLVTEGGKLSKSQELGAALTYARRYAICAILNITADDDSDGNATPRTSRIETTKETTKDSKRTISREEWLSQNRGN